MRIRLFCFGSVFLSLLCGPFAELEPVAAQSKWNWSGLIATNSDVSTRTKGVTEKCSFCSHRLQKALDEARVDDRDLEEGDYVPDCVEICPADAMYFGDLDEVDTTVSTLSRNHRAFKPLEDFGTEPKVTYLSEE
jgi:Fe-S-cluster-containing dehydrogenase component